MKEQSVTYVNSIWPSLSGSVLAIHEPLTARNDPAMSKSSTEYFSIEYFSTEYFLVVCAAAATMNELGNVLNRA